MLGFGRKNKGPSPTKSATDPVVDDAAVIYKVDSLSDITRAMGLELHASSDSGKGFFELEMRGVRLTDAAVQVDHERKITSIHFHPLEPHLRDDPVAQFLMGRYGLSFEEASLLVSMNDINHTLGTFDRGNRIASKMGLPAFNTHETAAGTVLVDENRQVILSGLLPVARIPSAELKQLQKAAQDGSNEQAYKGMTQETMKLFYDVVIDFTITNDRQARFLFEDGGMTHLIGSRFSFGIVDDALTRILRSEGDLDGTPLLTYGRGKSGAPFAVMISTHTTTSGSTLERVYALPLDLVQPNRRVRNALRRYTRAENGPVPLADFVSGVRRLLDENRRSLRPMALGDHLLDVLPPDLMPSEGGGTDPMRIGCVGSRHSLHGADHLLAYAMCRNTSAMQRAAID